MTTIDEMLAIIATEDNTYIKVVPVDCATCTQGDWEEYWVEVTSTSTNKD